MTERVSRASFLHFVISSDNIKLKIARCRKPMGEINKVDGIQANTKTRNNIQKNQDGCPAMEPTRAFCRNPSTRIAVSSHKQGMGEV